MSARSTPASPRPAERPVEQPPGDAPVEQAAGQPDPQAPAVAVALEAGPDPVRPVASRPRAGSSVSSEDVIESLLERGVPSRSRLVRRYSMFSGLGDGSRGTRSMMSRPKPSRPPYLIGLLVMSRMVVTPRSTSIWAPMPYSRLSTGRPSSRLASTVSWPLLLELVGADLVAQADAPALVAPQVDEHPAALGLDEVEGLAQLGSAVAAQRAEHVAGEALGVHPHQHVLVAGHVAHHEGQVLLAVEHRLVDVGRNSPSPVGIRASEIRRTSFSCWRR